MEIQGVIERMGVYYFNVTSDGMTGNCWPTRLENKGHRIGEYAKRVLSSEYFVPTSNVTYEIAVAIAIPTGRLTYEPPSISNPSGIRLPPGLIFDDSERNSVLKGIIKDGTKRKLLIPSLEVICLIREKFSNRELKEMGLHVFSRMGEPGKIFDEDLKLRNPTPSYLDEVGSWLNINYQFHYLHLGAYDRIAFDISQSE